MNNESGFGTSGAPYEYVVSEKMTAAVKRKKILFVALYILWGAGLLIVGSIVKLILPLLAFIPISLWILVYFTWRYTQVAYEYSFFGGEMKVNRLLGERSRRKLAEVKIRDFEAIYVCNAKNDEKMKEISADKEIFAASSKDAEGLSAVLWTDQDGQKTVLYFEADEKAVRILKYYNSNHIM